MRRFRFCAVVACTVLVVQLAQTAFAQTELMQFPVSKDNSIIGWDNHDGYGDPPEFDPALNGETEEWANHGYRANPRGRKLTQHGAIMDWDTDAINTWIAQNVEPDTPMTWTFNLYPIDAPDNDIEIHSLESLNEWAEGNGGNIDWGNGTGFTSFNWEPGTAASTTNFAQTFFTIAGNGDHILDEENSLPWIENETGTGGINDNQYGLLGRADNFSAGVRIPDFINTEPLFAVDIGDAAFDFTYATAPLDDDLVNAILNDPANVGIVLGPDPASGSNWKFWSRESTGEFVDDGAGNLSPGLIPLGDPTPGPSAPFLEVEYTPCVDCNPVLVGDFNLDGSLNAPDIDDLTGQSASGANDATYDLNADTLVNSDDVKVWIETLFNSWVGDLNLDLEFNSTDLTGVLASGTYESGAPSVWSQGDFNGDGVTDSGDLTFGLAGGGYELGPKGVSAVPEPSTFVILAFLSLGLLRFRRS